MRELGSRRYPAMPEGLVVRLDSKKIIRRERNDAIYQAGENADGLFLVKKGIVFSRQKSGFYERSLVNHVAHTGEFFGLESINPKSLYNADAVSANDSETIKIRQRELKELIATYPLYFLQLVTYNIRELELFSERLKLSASETVLLSIEDFRNGNNRISVDQSVIAERAGVTRGSVVNALSEAGIVWEDNVDPSLLRISQETRKKVEELIRNGLKFSTSGREVIHQIATELEINAGTIELVMNSMHIDESDFGMPLEEVTSRRLSRVVEEEPLDRTKRVLQILDILKDENGKLSITRKELLELTGVSNRTLQIIFREQDLDWGDLTYRKSEREVSPEVINKVTEEIDALRGEHGRVTLSQADFAVRVGLNPASVTRALSQLGLRWRDIADPSVYKKKDTQD